MNGNTITTAGGSAALIAAISDLAQSLYTKNYSTVVTDIGVIFAGVAGIYSKGWNVTGGSIPQTSEAERRT